MDSLDNQKSSKKTSKIKKKTKLKAKSKNSRHSSSSDSDEYSDTESPIEDITWLLDEVVEHSEPTDNSKIMLELLNNVNSADQDSNASSSEESYVFFELPKKVKEIKYSKESDETELEKKVIFLNVCFLRILTFFDAGTNSRRKRKIKKEKVAK